VEIFPIAPPEVVLVAKNSILDITRKKKQRKELRNHIGITSFSGAGET
jgi:hypothetical protein